MRTYSRPLLLLLLLLPLLSTIAACSQGKADQNPASDLSAQRLILSEGYSLLHADASNINRLEWMLYVKAESAEFNQVIRVISDYGEELKRDLERIAKDYPGVRLGLKPLPEMEMRKRFAIGKDRAIEFAPLFGRSGPEYERTVLISLSNALNHESHLCQVMAAEEPDPNLKKFLLASEQRYQELYALIMALLDRQHFKSRGGAIARP